MDHTTLDSACTDGAATLDREHVLDRHEERFLRLPLRLGDIVVDSLHQLVNALGLRRILGVLESLQSRPLDDRDLVAGELVLVEKLTHLELHEFEKLLVVDHVDLVHEDHETGHADLPGEENVLARLRHRTVRRADDEDSAVHLRRAGHHVLHVVRVARTVNVRIMTGLRLVLHVRRVDRDAALTLLGGVVDRVEGALLGQTLTGQGLSNRSGQGRLAVVNVTDGSDVDMGLGSFEYFLRHLSWTPSVRAAPSPYT